MICVSIHAPTRGATASAVITRSITNVSIHAPTRGATHETWRHTCRKEFQSTHPHGVRLLITVASIPIWCFNPRTHTGCDAVRCRLKCHNERVSIHAPTRGATPSFFRKMGDTGSFNPRTHTGCDDSDSCWANKAFTRVSIHAPTRGATVCKVTYYKSIN